MAEKIYQSVGNRGINATVDVISVQSLLNRNIGLLAPHLPLKVDGDCGPITIGLIIEFLIRAVSTVKPDGRIDPGGRTFVRLRELSAAHGNDRSSLVNRFNALLLEVQQWLKHNSATGAQDDTGPMTALSEGDYQNAANVLGVNIATVKAVARIESSGSGFLPNGKPKILFEGQHFSKFTDGEYDKSHPTLSYKTFTKEHYKKDGIAEFARFEMANGLDRNAAMLSASWGAFQIMGFNYKNAGYSSVEQFVEAMHISEANQLLAFLRFVESQQLDLHLRSRDWAAFARGYNGPKYEVNKYDKRLKQAYEAYAAGGS